MVLVSGVLVSVLSSRFERKMVGRDRVTHSTEAEKRAPYPWSAGAADLRRGDFGIFIYAHMLFFIIRVG